MLSGTILLLLTALGAANIAFAQTNITANACADPSAFTSCTTQALTASTGCMNLCAGNKICVLGCGCAMYQSYMNCVAESCWNQAYSCEYDELVAEYFLECPTATEPIPYWPAPDNAPAGCSCNLGKVLQSVLNAQKEYNSCITNNTSTSVIELSNKDTACGCCEVSAGLSAMYETCPDTIPAKMGADLWLNTATLYGAVIDWDTCGSVLDNYKCPNLGFAPPSSNSSTFYKPNSFPANGTQTLYNTGAATALTAPPSGSVFSWSQSSVTYTVTASPWKNNEVKATGTGESDGSGTGTAGAAGASKTSSTGAATSLKQSVSVVWLPVLTVLAKIMIA
ncbi:uncharacterized protein N7496_006838 [Penicillium cataractarum]|uniref:Extracellular membrane protein CFEM domain-containing protein n=1 Tax=Penicillium cataractarum TaxID=2100454 RepID=A0A9W9S2E6_9EURO|nr:uncharacterized protein N7496_006838 [Penicillium cataractarum]KAJ5370746.1 hypothetical protein N7496_006838 [Penicillium cataractarum]